MTQKNIHNKAASVHQKLLNLAKERQRPFNELLQLYGIERFLYRLSQSQHRNRFVLKGGLALLVWNTLLTRPTRDIDLLGKIHNDLDLVREIIAQICTQKVEDDGIVFDESTITTQRIVEDADYHGVRTLFTGFLGNARIPMQIDMGFDDVITPAPVQIVYPGLLTNPTASLLAYNPETSIAEKLEAMISIGQLNSRMKDFFDIWILARTRDFEGKNLADAIRKTFERRKTTITSAPACFSLPPDKAKESQWKAFIRSSQLTNAPVDFAEIISCLRDFLQPVLSAIENRQDFSGIWKSSGPWINSDKHTA